MSHQAEEQLVLIFRDIAMRPMDRMEEIEG